MKAKLADTPRPLRGRMAKRVVASPVVSRREPSEPICFPTEPPKMRLWRKVIERWDSLEEQVRYAMYPPDDWGEGEWDALTEERRQEYLDARRDRAEKPLAKLRELARNLTAPGGDQFETLANKSLDEHLLDLHEDVEQWIRDGEREDNKPLSMDYLDLVEMAKNARAEPHVKSGVQKVAAHIVAQAFPSSTTYNALLKRLKKAKRQKS